MQPLHAAAAWTPFRLPTVERGLLQRWTRHVALPGTQQAQLRASAASPVNVTIPGVSIGSPYFHFHPESISSIAGKLPGVGATHRSWLRMLESAAAMGGGQRRAFYSESGRLLSASDGQAQAVASKSDNGVVPEAKLSHTPTSRLEVSLLEVAHALHLLHGSFLERLGGLPLAHNSLAAQAEVQEGRDRDCSVSIAFQITAEARAMFPERVH